MRSNLVDIDVVLVHSTDKAYLIKYDEDKEPVWVPKSLSEYANGVLTLPEPVAIEKGLI